jgi:capsular exopolysaccharide synthesis family protein
MENTEMKPALPPGRQAASYLGRHLPLSEAVLEYCETLLCRLLWAHDASSPPLRALGVTSCCRGEGVSTVATQLAVTAASVGQIPVLLVDANIEHPSLHQTFPVMPTPGWTEVVKGAKPFGQAIQPSGVENLSILPSGRASPDHSQPWEVADLAGLFQKLKAEFELIVCDLPAVGQTGRAVRLAGCMDGVLLVVEAERVRWEAAQKVKELLSDANAHLVGAVLNKRRHYAPAWLYRTL